MAVHCWWHTPAISFVTLNTNMRKHRSVIFCVNANVPLTGFPFHFTFPSPLSHLLNLPAVNTHPFPVILPLSVTDLLIPLRRPALIIGSQRCLKGVACCRWGRRGVVWGMVKVSTVQYYWVRIALIIHTGQMDHLHVTPQRINSFVTFLFCFSFPCSCLCVAYRGYIQWVSLWVIEWVIDAT